MLLPQYQRAETAIRRFVVATHDENAAIERSTVDKDNQRVDSFELEADALSYFTENKEYFREEFSAELEQRLQPGEFQLFCEVVAHEWYDGKRLRENGRPRRLKRTVYDYLRAILGASFPMASVVQTADLPTDVEPLISVEGVASILTVNGQLLHRHIEEWKRVHPDRDNLASDDVFLRRGIRLEQRLDENDLYREWDLVNSYSIAISAPEKFAQLKPERGPFPVIVNGEFALFEGRVLFFSPFIPGMEVEQLEFGVIHAEKPLPVHCQGEHGGILEYIIDPTPLQK